MHRHRVSTLRRLATLSTKEEFPLTFSLSPAARAAPVIKEATTSNGVRLIARDSGASMVSINFAVTAGSSSEGPCTKGAALLLSASAFAGTGKRSGLKLMRDLENMGAVVGSSVDREKITYTVTCLPEKAEEAIAAVSEVLTSGPTSAYVLDESKDAADLAVAAHKGCPKSQALELLYEAAYGENTPMGSPVYTSAADAAAASVSHFRKANFYAGNVVVSATGISIDSLRTMAELYLHGLPSDPAAGTLLPTKASPYVGGDMKARDNSVGSSHLALGFPVPKGVAGAGDAYKVLAQALSSKIADMPVPRDSVACFLHQGASGGLLGIYAHGQAAAAIGFLEAAVAELKALAGAGAGTESAKVKTALDAFLALEGGKTGATVLLDAALSSTSPVADARKVTPATVASAAKAALAAAPSYAVYGVTAGTPSYAAVTKMTKA